jgi:hypothetical protein
LLEPGTRKTLDFSDEISVDRQRIHRGSGTFGFTEGPEKQFLGFVETLVSVDALGCFAPAAAAPPGAISLKNVCLMFLSLKEYPGFPMKIEEKESIL